jgi:TRAP transporter TAXI family solute receptor
MAKLKTLPKAIIVGSVVALLGFVAYKFMPKTQADTAAIVATAPVAPAIMVAPNVEPQPQPQPQPQMPVLNAGGKLPGAGIASGQKTGTNWPMAEDIVKACSTDDYPLRNVISDGSIDNINKIYTDPNSQFGIAQEDALAYQQKIDPKMMSRVVAVFPFFSVEVHAIVANGSPINSLADLAGKRVVEGPEGSGTWVTVQLIKQQTGIQWETVEGNLSQAAGLKAVQTGAADVEFIVAGQPIRVLSGANGVKLIPIQHPALDKFGFYTKAMLPTGTYPWQGTPISTYKVNNVLATFAYKNQYQKEIGNLVTCITRNIDQLQASGHPKWRDVDPLDIERVKWAVHPSALAAIKREAKRK